MSTPRYRLATHDAGELLDNFLGAAAEHLDAVRGNHSANTAEDIAATSALVAVLAALLAFEETDAEEVLAEEVLKLRARRADD